MRGSIGKARSGIRLTIDQGRARAVMAKKVDGRQRAREAGTNDRDMIDQVRSLLLS